MKNTDSDEKMVSSLMLASFSQTSHSVRNKYSVQQAEAELSRWGYYSVFDIVKTSPARFIRRHRNHFDGQAETLYQNALSYATQLVHVAREQGLREAELNRLSRVKQGQTELPSYADLFPEPWDNFCKPGATEALNSRAAYLLELYQFSRQLELDASEGAVTFSQRRPDIPLLLIDHDNDSKEVPALQVVNEILSLIAAEYIDKSGQSGKPVWQVLDETHYPYSLPFSLPTLQSTLGMKEKKTSLTEVISTLRQETPLFFSRQSPGATNSALLAATGLSSGQMQLLITPTPFPTQTLTKPELTATFITGSTTEILMQTDLSQHGYVIPAQEGASGPKSLNMTALPLTEMPFDLLEVQCTNAQGMKVTVTLRAQAVLTCRRLKRRLKPFADRAPYPRQLQLSWHDEDNAGVDLTQGPWFGKIIIEAHTWENKCPYTAFHYQLALSDKALPAEQLAPEAGKFFKENFGITPHERAQLTELQFFIEKTKGTAEEVEQLIAWGDFSPVVSDNMVFSNLIFSNGQSELRFPLPFQAGASYLNAGQPASTGIDASRPRRFSAISNQRFDRLQRLIRLQRWLALPANELDWLIQCTFQAEGEHNLARKINMNTLRVLGLWRHLHGRYNLSVESFSAFINSLSPFSVSGKPAFLDQVFNQPKLFDLPFCIDDQPFNFTAPIGDGARTVKQLCAGLAVSLATFRELAPQVSRAFGLPEGMLNRSLPVVSALYRLVMVPKLFGLTPEQGTLLIQVLSEQGAFSADMLAGIPLLSPLNADGNDTTTVDILDAILLLEELARWLKTSKIRPEELCLMLQSYKLPVVATESSVTFFSNLLQGMPKTLLREGQFQAADIPQLAAGNTWMSLLSAPKVALIDEDGLVKSFVPVWGSSDERHLQAVLTPIVEKLTDPDSVSVAVSALSLEIIQAKTAQEELLSSAIAREYGTGRDMVAGLLQWCGSSVYDFLSKTGKKDEAGQRVIRTTNDIPDMLLDITYHLAMNAQLVKQLRLKPLLLNVRLSKPEWLGLAFVDGKPLTLPEIWALSAFRQWASQVQYSEEELIDYLAYAGQTPDSLPDEEEHNQICAELLSDILEWDAEEIAQAIGDAEPARACSVPQIDWLRRIKALSARTGLSVSPLRAAAMLPPFPSYAQITFVGEAVIAATQTLSEEY